MPRTSHSCIGVIGWLMFPFTAAAQIPGNLDWPLLTTENRSLHAEVARGLNDASGKTTYVGARLGIPARRTAFWAGGGVCDQCGAGDLLVTAGLGLAVPFPIQGSSVAATGQAGLGFSRSGGENLWSVPVGVALSFAASPRARLWVMPQFVIAGVGSTTEAGFSALGGVLVTGSSRVGVHAGLQWSTIGGATPLGIGGGVHLGL